jgi:hypothetical protein
MVHRQTRIETLRLASLSGQRASASGALELDAQGPERHRGRQEPDGRRRDRPWVQRDQPWVPNERPLLRHAPRERHDGRDTIR